ncbi:MAG TPA: oxidoreductase [Porphyromonadaceae bacterium]|nr:Gfo/Idh/MocA family oxidoreductase [Paramuribaculum sp.]HAB41527.1 oxidoreductase [Porphyromonadaceae bacterium]
MSEEISRRQFLKSGAMSALGLMFVPSSVLGKTFGHVAPSDKLNIAVVGIGGMGHANINAVKETENIVALCDVNWNYAKGVFDEFPKAKRYWDYRKMFDEMGKDIDAVIVATPDHTHAIVAADAMTMGKHVFVQKPLTHSVYESRLLTKLAETTGVATQMGNQGASGEGTNLVCDWIWNGEIGDVTLVECATDRPIWPQGLNIPEKVDKVPKYLDWDLFTGPAKMNPYNEIYQPWNWRGWWDYGTGALGDMACHILHQPFKALNLKYPIKAEGSSTLLLSACAPQAQHVKLTFPARDNMAKVAMPEVEVHWYDGGLLPDRPAGFPQGKSLMPGNGGLTIFHGTKDTLICGCYGSDPFLLSGRTPNAPKVARRVSTSHEMDWVRACKESKESRVKCNSDFSEAGPFNEMVAMGVLAVRLQGLNKTLEWDGENMCFTNIGDNEEIKTVIKDGFKIHNGHPTFDKTWTDPVNAREFAAELIKHNYRDGWKLPDMPA